MSTIKLLEKTTPAIVLLNAMCANHEDVMQKFGIDVQGCGTTVEVKCTVNGVEIDIEEALLGYFNKIDEWVADKAAEIVKERVGSLRLEQISSTLGDLARAVDDLANYPISQVEFEIEQWLKENRK